MAEAPYWFVWQGQPRGPLGKAELVSLWRDGVCTDLTPVWQEEQDQWRPFAQHADLVAAAALPTAKRRRIDNAAGGGGGGCSEGAESEGGEGSDDGSSPERAELPPEFGKWLAELDEEALEQLFFVGLLRYRPHVVRGLAAERDALLSAFVSRFPECEDSNPENYSFSDEFLCNTVDDVTGKEALWALMGKGNEAAARAIIAAAAQLDERYLGRVYAFWACAQARRLIAAGDLDGLLGLLREDEGLLMTRDMHGRTVLHSLATAGELLVRVLEAMPAMASQRDAVDEDLNVPLHLAAQASDEAAVAALLGAGADPNLQNRDTSQYASGQWNVKSADLDFPVPVPQKHQTPLHIAAEQGDHGIMRLLIGKGAKLDVRDTAGSTPLHLALEQQDLEAVQLLLAAGANPCLANSDMGEDSTPLHQCCSGGQARLAEALLATGKLDASAPGPQGWTPLHLAVRRGSLPCVELLLKHGADVNARANGKTPLDLAAVNKREKIAEVLRAAGGQASA